MGRVYPSPMDPCSRMGAGGSNVLRSKRLSCNGARSDGIVARPVSEFHRHRARIRISAVWCTRCRILALVTSGDVASSAGDSPQIRRSRHLAVSRSGISMHSCGYAGRSRYQPASANALGKRAHSTLVVRSSTWTYRHSWIRGASLAIGWSGEPHSPAKDCWRDVLSTKARMIAPCYTNI